jgi:hypothetical protein
MKRYSQLDPFTTSESECGVRRPGEICVSAFPDFEPEITSKKRRRDSLQRG